VVLAKLGDHRRCGYGALMLTTFLIVQSVAILLLAVLVAGLLRAHGEVLRILHNNGISLDKDSPTAPHPGRSIPVRASSVAAHDITGVRLGGGATKIGIVGAPGSTLLAFLSTGCSSCGVIWREMANPALEVPGENTRLVVVAKGPEAESVSRLEELAPSDLLVVQSSDAWDRYQVPVTPYFVLVDGSTGTVQGEGTAASWTQMIGLMRQAVADARSPARRSVDSGPGELQADEELRKAGIGPGHESLYPGSQPPVER